MKYKNLVDHVAFTAGLYTIIYWSYTFTVWRFDNPVQWIIDIPTYESTDRFLILFFWVFYHVALAVLIHKRPQTKKEFNKQVDDICD